ncbi:MAG: hypothetical protein HY701_08355 [Gemmatimonadetes bacterium]|nr:hypothetical protein [Gemmatimonadota bacterium]
MKRTGLLRANALTVALVMFASACSVDARGPLAPSADLLGDAAPVLPMLQRTGPVSELSVTQEVGPLGGTIQLGGGELEVSIPAGALAEPTWITLTRPAGNDVEYRFSPHGLQFAQPVTVKINLLNTPAASSATILNSLVAVYFVDDDHHGTHEVSASELFPVSISLDLRAVFKTSHFSGYCMAMD